MGDVLDLGYVRLIRWMGGDSAVLEAARICYQTESSGPEADIRLINRLINSDPEHGTPFEHAVFQFEVKCPIFTARQHLRHRAGCSYNERSLRYTVADREYYTPKELRKTVNGWPDGGWEYQEAMEAGFDAYEYLRELGIPKELARGVIGTAVYTEFMWTVNARALMHFITQRIDSHAQWEIRQYAKALLDIMIEVMPITGKIFAEKIGVHSGTS